MAQNYTLMARKNLLKPDETPKYYAVARSGRKVTVKEVCKRISERSSYSKGELEGCSRHRASIRAKYSFIPEVISANCVRRWIIHCIRTILRQIRTKIRFLMTVTTIKEVPAVG